MFKTGVPLWIFILALLAVATVTFALVYKTEWNIQSGVEVVAYELKVYEKDGKTECHNIDWGPIERGYSSHYDIIANNTGDYTLNLEMNSTLSSSVGAVSWDYNGTALHAGQSIPVQLTFNVSDTAPRSICNFTINIYGWISG